MRASIRMNEQQAPQPPPTKRNRSPNFPATDLKDALEKAKLIWQADRRASIGAASLASHWGFSEKSSSLLKVIGALKQFGLLVQEESGQHKLTDAAIQILANED